MPYLLLLFIVCHFTVRFPRYETDTIWISYRYCRFPRFGMKNLVSDCQVTHWDTWQDSLADPTFELMKLLVEIAAGLRYAKLIVSIQKWIARITSNSTKYYFGTSKFSCIQSLSRHTSKTNNYVMLTRLYTKRGGEGKNTPSRFLLCDKSRQKKLHFFNQT